MSLSTSSSDALTVCTICGSSAMEAWKKLEHQLYECLRCKHLFCLFPGNDYVAENYGDEYFDGGAGGYTNYLENEKALIEQGKTYSRIISKHTEKGALLDVGSAAGFLLQGFVSDGWIGTGIEPNSKMAKYAESNFDLKIYNQVFEDFDTDACFDAISLIQVISHLPDPVRCLARVHELLRNHGILLIETWNRKSWTAQGFGRNWHQYNPPSVLHWYTRNELATILHERGFEVVSTGRPTKWISVGNGAALVRHSFRQSTIGRFLTSPLGLIPKALKVPYFLDDVFWTLARKKD